MSDVFLPLSPEDEVRRMRLQESIDLEKVEALRPRRGTSPFVVLPPIPERDFLATVVELAQAHHWLVHHVLEQRHFARRIGPGFPDLVLINQPPMRPRIIFAELKREGAVPSVAQAEWLEALVRCVAALSPVEVYLWRPSQLDNIEQILAARGS